MKICSKCNTKCEDKANFCFECGNSFKAYFVKPEKNQDMLIDDKSVSLAKGNEEKSKVDLSPIYEDIKKLQNRVNDLEEILSNPKQAKKFSDSSKKLVEVPTDLIEKMKFWKSFKGYGKAAVLMELGKPDQITDYYWYYGGEEDYVGLSFYDDKVNKVRLPNSWFKK